MYYYIALIFLVSLLSASTLLFKSKVYEKSSMWVLVLLCSIMPGFKGTDVGTDTRYYLDIFSWDISAADWLVRGIEPGFFILVELINLFEVEKYSFFIFSLLFNYLIISSIYFFKNYRTLMLISFLTFSLIYLSHFNILRQSISLAFFVKSIIFLIDKKIVKGYMYILFAALFHYSAIPMLTLPIILKYLQRHYFFISTVSALLVVLYAIFYKYLIPLIVLWTGASRYSYYSTDIVDRSSILLYGFYVLIFILIALLYKNERNYKLFLYFIFMYVVFGACINFLGLPYEGPGRISVYYSAAFIFLIPLVIERFNSDVRVILIPCFYFFMIIFFMTLVYFANYHEVFPYSFW